jgi:hypothetical membrane protein
VSGDVETRATGRPAAHRVAAGSGLSTRTLLLCGVVAGPVYVVVGVMQMLVRDGFDIRRHALSLMSNGDLGWIQITNFVLTGLLVVACSVGMRRVLHPGIAGTWGPRLLAAYGVGLIAAGVFIADPYDGFPPGTPPGVPDSVSWHGALHLVAATVAFLSLIAACLVFARRFVALGQRGRAAYAVATGVFYFAAFAGLMSGSGQSWIAVAFSVAVVLGWAWISVTAAQLLSGRRAEAADGQPGDFPTAARSAT